MNDEICQMNYSAVKDILKGKINDKGYVFLIAHILDDVATLMLEYIEKYEKNDVVLDRLFDLFHNEDHTVIAKDYNDFIRELTEKEIIVHD